MNITDPKLEDYALKHSAPEKPLFKALVKATNAKTKYPQMQVGHLEGQFLATLVKLTGAKRILEIGTFTGYSALAMAEALPANGRLITLDIDPINTAIAREFWKKSSSGRKITLHLGPAMETLKKVKGLLDMVFIDADKENYVRYWNACVPKMRRGGLIVVDNVLWSGRVLKPQDPMDHAIVRTNKAILADRRVEALMLPVRDGMTLALKK